MRVIPLCGLLLEHLPLFQTDMPTLKKPVQSIAIKPAVVTSAVTGTQAIRRAGAILRAIAKAGVTGTSLAEIARAEVLSRTTTHRILRCLVEEGFVEFTPDNKRYQMGHLIHELGLTSASSAAEVGRWREVVEAISRAAGVTCYLMRRSGIEAVCLLKADSHSVMRFVPVEVGQRRLLGVGAGAAALLAALDPKRIDQVITAIAPSLAAFPRINPETLHAGVELTQRTGFAISQGTVVADGFGMGIALPGSNGPPHLAISIAAHASLVSESTITAWKKIMRDAIASARSG